MMILAAMCIVPACAPPAAPTAAPPAAPTAAPPAADWLELAGARMLVTTTRAAQGRSDAGLPILIVLPWSRSTPAEVLAEVGYIDIALPARVVAIEGFEADGAGFSWWRRTRPAPADPDRDDELIALLTERAARLAAVVGAVQRHFGSAPPVVSGISQGGDLSIALGVLHPRAIAAALPIAARFPAPMWPPSPASEALPPVDAFQGERDPVAPFTALRRAADALRERGFPVAVHAYPSGHEVTPALAADLRACAALRLRGRRDRCPGGDAGPPAR
jgi:phospholipase/carboxylesterase